MIEKAMTAPDQNPNQDPLIKAKALMRSGDFGSARDELLNVLRTHIDHIEALYSLAVCYRKCALPSEAFRTLNQLIQLDPKHGHAHQERGFLLLADGKPDEAMAAFDTAVGHNPALHASWKNLAAMPEYAQQNEAKRLYAWLSSLPPQLVSVSSYIHQGKLYMAEQLCRQFLKANPHHPEAMRLLAELGTKFQILDDAEFLLESCLEFNPDFLHARLDYVAVLHRRQKFKQSLEQARKLLDVDPENAGFQISVANALQAMGDFDEAVKTYEQVLAKQPDNHDIYLAKGHAQKTMGLADKAIGSYRKSYQVKPDFGDAYWSLANLKTYVFTDDELAAMQTAERDERTSEQDRICLCFALGKAYEDRRDYSKSFSFYERGNRLKHDQGGYNRQRIEAELQYQKDHFDEDFFSTRAGSGCAAPDPIFVVGLPRAGSTLVEQILASHSQVEGTMELSNIIGMAHQLNGRRLVSEEPLYPSVLSQIPVGDLAKFGQRYIDETLCHRGSAPFFIDKMPNNFRHIAFIKLILPNAKIIDARREPMACCFSGYKQLFAEGQEFSYNLDDVGRYYRSYVDVMDHWDQTFPGSILKVQHEDVLNNLEAEVARILNYCGLPFEQSCVDFHKTERAVRTPSSEQVRQPIFKTSMEQWRNYETFLAPLKQALSVGTEFSD
jgi:tetratricopeptide (TPR) repeat protein